jgi:hypothetical protein
MLKFATSVKTIFQTAAKIRGKIELLALVQCTFRLNPANSAAGVLDEPDAAKPDQWSNHTGPPGYIGWTVDTVPANVDWRACTATLLSGIS